MIGGHHFLRARLEARLGLRDGVPVYDISDSCPEKPPRCCKACCSFPSLRRPPPTKYYRELQSADEVGTKSGDQWYGVQVTPLEPMRFIFQYFHQQQICRFLSSSWVNGQTAIEILYFIMKLRYAVTSWRCCYVKNPDLCTPHYCESFFFTHPRCFAAITQARGSQKNINNVV